MRMIARKMLAGAAVTGACLTMFTCLAGAEEEKPTANLTVGAYSHYISRGFELSKDSIVIQPSMTIAYKGFSANVWGNLDTDPYFGPDDANNWNETDMTLKYGWEMEPVIFSVGYTYYAYDASDDTQEVFVTGTLKTFLKPTLSITRDIDHSTAWYVSLGISHSVPVKDDITLDLAASAGYLSADDASSYSIPSEPDDAYSALHDGVVSMGFTIPVAKYITVNPKISYTFALSDDAEEILSKDGKDDSIIFGGVSVSLAF